ncbi:MAG: hypothetical protein GY804_12500 [Alphaproteobacteria bacterium]|nr:hypothetical protein [Alphaproteobacteria bacterium]
MKFKKATTFIMATSVAFFSGVTNVQEALAQSNNTESPKPHSIDRPIDGERVPYDFKRNLSLRVDKDSGNITAYGQRVLGQRASISFQFDEHGEPEKVIFLTPVKTSNGKKFTYRQTTRDLKEEGVDRYQLYKEGETSPDPAARRPYARFEQMRSVVKGFIKNVKDKGLNSRRKILRDSKSLGFLHAAFEYEKGSAECSFIGNNGQKNQSQATAARFSSGKKNAPAKAFSSDAEISQSIKNANAVRAKYLAMQDADGNTPFDTSTYTSDGDKLVSINSLGGEGQVWNVDKGVGFSVDETDDYGYPVKASVHYSRVMPNGKSVDVINEFDLSGDKNPMVTVFSENGDIVQQELSVDQQDLAHYKGTVENLSWDVITTGTLTGDSYGEFEKVLGFVQDSFDTEACQQAFDAKRDAEEAAANDNAGQAVYAAAAQHYLR